MGLVDDIAQTYIKGGQQQAEAQRQTGQLYGSALSKIGELAAGIPQQLVEQKRLDLQAQEQQMRVDAIKRSQAAQQQANQVIAGLPKNDDGTYDTGALMQRFAQSNVPLDDQERFTTTLDKLNGVITSANKAKLNHFADLANVLIQTHHDGEPYTPDAVHLGFAAAKAAGLANDDDEQRFVQMMAAGADPEQVLKTVRGLGDKYNAPPKFAPLPANAAGIVNEATGQITPTNVPARLTNEAEMRQAAARVGTPREQPGDVDAKTAVDAIDSHAKTATPPNVGSFDDYVVRKYGPKPTPEQVIQARKDYGQADDRAAGAATVVVQTIDENGKPVTRIVPKVAGASYPKAPSGTTENRLASAEAVTQTGNEITAKLADPKYAGVVGPLMGRYNSVRDWVGNPPPELAELAGMVESYALANMGVHGMRSAQGAEQIKKLLDAKHTPQSLAAAIKGLQRFSENFMQNQGRKLPGTTAPASTAPTGGLPGYQDYLKSRGSR